MVSFDTVAPPLDGERELFDTLATLIHSHRGRLQALIEARAREAAARREAARRLVAELLVELAARRDRLADSEDDDAALQVAVERLRADVRSREQACVDALLRLYRFRADDARMADLPLADGRWDDDLFNPETLRQMGVRLGTGAAAGAAAGVGIDLMTGGLTLGAAAALGAIAGGLWQTFGHYGERLAAKLRGHRELTVDDAILRIVALRQRSLILDMVRRNDLIGYGPKVLVSDPQVGVGLRPLALQPLPPTMPLGLLTLRGVPPGSAAKKLANLFRRELQSRLPHA